jgi:IclR family transcriptional regulator, pca regulon regulatory protein
MTQDLTEPYADLWKIPELAEPRYSQSLERGLAILECFTPEQPLKGIADIAEELGMSRASTHRYMSTLHALGYLEQGLRRKYSLTLRVTRLGLSTLSATGLVEQARPELLDLSRRVGFTVGLVVLDGEQAVYLETVHGRRRPATGGGGELAVGERLPAHCLAAGKALLAWAPLYACRELLAQAALARRAPNTITSKAALRRELEAIREHAFATEDEELAQGRVAIAAPLHDRTSDPPAAVDLSADAGAIAIEELADALGPHLVATADRISARLGYRRESGGG